MKQKVFDYIEELERKAKESEKYFKLWHEEKIKNNKAIEYIYLHSTQRKWFADISDRLHNQEIQFKGRIQDLLDILKGDDKE